MMQFDGNFGNFGLLFQNDDIFYNIFRYRHSYMYFFFFVV